MPPLKLAAPGRGPVCPALGPPLITPSTNEKRMTILLSSFMQIDNEAAMWNGVLQFNDYEESRMTRCCEVLPTAPPSIQHWIFKLLPNLGNINCKCPFTFLPS
ncbi:hypothetical protein TNCV_697931 [Trichonephila clavipes]|nr:hypothetical protein TNCV_697931 [Trichonephila clavipes]